MPSGSYKQADVKCPFFKYDDGKRRITCEGLIRESSLALIYLRKSDYEAQIDTFCCERFVHCGIYRLLMEKYENIAR